MKTFLLFVFAACLWVFSSKAQTGIVESFDYPVETVLDTLAGETGGGWSGAWDSFGEGTTSLTVIDTVFHYSFLDYPDVPYTSTHAASTTTGAWTTNRWGRYLDQVWTDEAGKVYWISALMELLDYSTNQSWAGVGLYDSTSEGPLLGKGWGDFVYSFGTGNAQNPGEKSETTWDSGPVWLVARIQMSGDTLTERLHMWISPDPSGGEPDTANADTHSDYDGLNNGFNRIAVHYGGELTGMNIIVDEIRLGTSWESVSSPLVGVRNVEKIIPGKYNLSQNYPNPFNPSTKIRFSINESGLVTLKVYNIMGEEVAAPVNEYKNIGVYEVDFNAKDLTAGVYFYKISTANFSETKKMILIK
jgi:hypothetical protein